ncbi:MAG TPA: ATP-grasp domain-containing protein [Caulobacteraceae bacterium]|nr:ATP-grasp domain-containing protein [Caulobacteraceae bacterium]
MRGRRDKLRVALIGVGWPLTLYLANALRARGLDVLLLTAGKAFPAKRLKPWLHAEHIASVDSPEAHWRYRELAEDPAVTWIYPLTEPAIAACHQAIGGSPKLFPSLSAETLALIVSKQNVSAFARQHGLATPASNPAASKDDAVSIARALGYPVVVKGQGGNSGARVAICRDEAAVRDSYDAMSAFDPFVEAYIEGETWIAGGFFLNGRAIRLQICRAVETDPPKVGHSLEVEHEAPEALRSATLKFYQALRWTGYANADFIRAADGQFYFLESNPRPWGSMVAAEAVGIPMFDAAADHFLGKTPKVDLADGGGRRCYVMPDCLETAINRQGPLGLVRMLLDPRLWRGYPRRYARANAYFLRALYWPLHRWWRERRPGVNGVGAGLSPIGRRQPAAD